MEIEKTPPNAAASDTTSTCEYMDAEGEPETDADLSASDLYQEAVHGAEAEQQGHSIISVLRDELVPQTSNNLSPDSETTATTGQSKELAASVESLALSTSTSAKTEDSGSTNALDEDIYDYQHDSVWRGQKKHIFILSEAGKPIYSLHGNEDKLATLFGVIQALVSFVQLGQDAITSIHAGSIKFAFMQRNSLILVAASRTNMSVQQLQLQLR